MKQTTLALLILIVILLLSPVKAQLTATVTYTPTTPLPGDYVRGVLTVKTTTPEKITGISFMTQLKVSPKDVSGIGTLPADSEYSLPFTLKVQSPGIYTVKIYIFTDNGTLVKTLNLNVVNSMPKIIITSPITLNEVNFVHFTVYSIVDAKDIIVKPLFKAYPSVIAVDNGKGVFEFYPKKPETLKFKIEFYNGIAENYHSYIQTIHPAYKNSKGIVLNISTPHSYYMLCDVIPLNLEVSNLRDDTVYSVNISVVTGNFSKNVKIPSIKPNDSSSIVVNCPAYKKGREEIHVTLQYLDSFGNKYVLYRNYSVNILPEKTVRISDLSIERNLNGIEITGDVSNNGWSKVYGVTVMAGNKSYFIGTIDPSDYDTFDIVVSNLSNLKVTWQNSLGQIFTISKKVQFKEKPVVTKKTGNSAILVAVVGSIFIIVLALLGLWRRNRKNDE